MIPLGEDLFYNKKLMNNRPITSLKRAFRLAWKNFHRESGLSFVSAFVLMTVITLAASLLLVGGIAEILIKDIEQKADVTIDFELATGEETILNIKEEISEEFEINDISYTSREDAKVIFISRHGDNPIIMESLEEVGNPFPASLNINADDPYTYRQIASFLEEEHEGLIYNIDFHNREDVIETIFAITSNIRSGGITVAVILAVIAILLVYSTVKLAIYGVREEIKVMRLVGSSNVFIQSSFIIQGMIIGAISAAASFLILFTLGFFIPQTYNITLEVNLHQYFLEMLPYILILQFLVGIFLGTVSSLIATTKYLK